MRGAKYLSLIAAGVFALTAVPKDGAQVSIGVNIGPEPGCPYGYYDYAPYPCAPYGYYGPEWFGTGGLFVGAGPWFHGPRNFYGHVDNRFRPENGYRGPFPERGDARFNHFHGNEMREPNGHVHAEEHGGGRR